MPRAAALIALLVSGCVTVIRPPVSPEDPVLLVLVDYGYHSSLVLPLREGGSVEYAYGEWNWFALNKDSWYHAIPTLCWPTQGALGRRRLAAAPGRSALRGLVSGEEMLEFRVARSRAEALVADLDELFRRYLDTQVYNPVNDLTFVHGEDDYWCLSNCNHILARWLRELGCDVAGSALFSSWRLSR